MAVLFEPTDLHESAPIHPSPAPQVAPEGTGAGTMTVMLDGQPVQVGVTLTSTVLPPPPPPPAPILAAITVAPASVVGGQPSTGTVYLAAAIASPTTVPLSSNSGMVVVPASVSVPAGSVSQTFPIATVLVSAGGTVTVSAGLGGVTKSASLSVTAPAPPPTPTEVDVRAYGAKGDGITDDHLAIQRAIDATTAGQVVRFPAGVYNTGSTPLSVTRAVKLVGAGGKLSTIANIGVIVRIGATAGPAVAGVEIRGLHFRGQVGRYMATGNTWPAIQNLAGQGLVVDDCDFSGCGWLVSNMGISYGSVLTNLRGIGWGEAGFFINGGETIRNCKIVQDDPALAHNSSHGFYIHSGAHDVLIEDCWVENCRNYGFQLYGQEVPSTIQRVTIRRCSFVKGRSGGTIYQPMLGAARASDVLIENCLFKDTYEGASLYVTGGDRIKVQGCTFDGGSNALQIGVWAPSQVGFSIVDFTFAGNTIKNQTAYGIWQGSANGGTFTRCVIGPGNSLSGNRQDYQRDNAPGITYL